jgi:hypothetical protein
MALGPTLVAKSPYRSSRGFRSIERRFLGLREDHRPTVLYRLVKEEWATHSRDQKSVAEKTLDGSLARMPQPRVSRKDLLFERIVHRSVSDTEQLSVCGPAEAGRRRHSKDIRRLPAPMKGRSEG